MYVMAVRLSTGLKGRKCTSVMFARAYRWKGTLCIYNQNIIEKQQDTRIEFEVNILSQPPLDQQAYW